MNKAFVREPDADARVYCPRCKSLGMAVGGEAIETHAGAEATGKIGDGAWFCGFARCEVAYFNQFEMVVLVDELRGPIYPKDLDAPICACFGLSYDDVEADVREGRPTRVRELLEKSRTSEARCESLAANGRCCVGAVQELFMKLRGGA